jgi:CheY-like chemotaxis protein
MPERDAMPSMRTSDERPLVLVVEDDVANRALLERLLDREGYRTKAVGDGEAGLLAVAEHAPDLVLLDIGLGPPRWVRGDPSTAGQHRDADGPDHPPHRTIDAR